MSKMRLQKFLAAAGVASRRESEELIKQGKVKVNDQVITAMGINVDSETDQVKVKNKIVTISTDLVYIALNKPIGYLSTVKRMNKIEKIVLDLVDVPERVFPVGRLDKDSQGLLLLTNDGKLTDLLTHPKYEHEKEYVVTVEKKINFDDLIKMSKGIDIRGYVTQPAKVKKLLDKKFSIVLKEGKKRQIRRMTKAVGYHVKKLERVRIGKLELGDIKIGKWRFLTEQEVKSLYGKV